MRGVLEEALAPPEADLAAAFKSSASYANEVQIVLKYAQSISNYDEAIFRFVFSRTVEI